MPIKTVLFDFHYALARCDCQLDTEMKDLPYLLLDVLIRDGALPASAKAFAEQASTQYQHIRARMRTTGIAVDLMERAEQVLDM